METLICTHEERTDAVGADEDLPLSRPFPGQLAHQGGKKERGIYHLQSSDSATGKNRVHGHRIQLQ